MHENSHYSDTACLVWLRFWLVQLMTGYFTCKFSLRLVNTVLVADNV